MSELARIVRRRVFWAQPPKGWRRFLPTKWHARDAAKRVLSQVPGLAQALHDGEILLSVRLGERVFNVLNKHGRVEAA